MNERSTTHPIKVLLAIEPLMYREVMASYLRHHRPQAEVILASGETLQAEVERVRPLLIIANEPSQQPKRQRPSGWGSASASSGSTLTSVSMDTLPPLRTFPLKTCWQP